MRGELIGVWSETIREIWDKLAHQDNAPNDLYCELYREISVAFKSQPTVEELAEVIDDPIQSKDAFQSINGDDLAGERALVKFFAKTYEALDDLGGYALSNPYYNLLDAFIEKYSLRYDLQRPCTLAPTLPGMFASLLRDLRLLTSQDTYLESLMTDFESAVRDLGTDPSDGRIKTCIQKQVNLLEALGRVYPGVTQTTLGRICDELGTWPHLKIRDAMKNLYSFASDYPGIRHGGTPTSAIRPIDMRDMIAMCILLAGFTPYFTDQLDAEIVYRGN
jgi:hypothetical protein